MLDSRRLIEFKATEAVKFVFVSHFEPKPIGNGGNHRSYQIYHDLAQIVGGESVVLISWPEWRKSFPVQPEQRDLPAIQRFVAVARRVGRRILPYRRIAWWLRQVHQRLKFLTVEHPVDLLIEQGKAPKPFSAPEFLAYYRKRLSELRGEAVCVIEHPGFSGILPINRQLGIPTIACFQNIEAFDTAISFQVKQMRQTHQAALSFADEFQVLAQCDARLFISKVEAGLVGGLGASSLYYPYLPVGEIRCANETIRAKRALGNIEQGLFLMVGTAEHTTTRQAFQWIVQQAIAQGLPEGSKLVVCGSGTETLLPAGVTGPGLELRGWVGQAVLDDLLCRAEAVLAPQTVGFGTLTRLSELSLAGVPVITSQHPAYALDLPPGITVVGDRWEDWKQAMRDLMKIGRSFDAAAYQIWEDTQINTLNLVVKELLTTLCYSKSIAAQTEEGLYVVHP